MQKMWSNSPRDGKNEFENLEGTSAFVKEEILDICQHLLESRSHSLGSRQPGFDSNEFRQLLEVCVVRHELPF